MVPIQVVFSIYTLVLFQCSGPLMGLHGTPRDYAWGPQGLDNIISQMLANLEDNGPPPTEKEKIEGLPIVEVTMEDLHECKCRSPYPKHCILVVCLFVCLP